MTLRTVTVIQHTKPNARLAFALDAARLLVNVNVVIRQQMTAPAMRRPISAMAQAPCFRLPVRINRKVVGEIIEVAHEAHPMTMPIEFRSSVVLRADGKVFVVLFDGEPTPGTVAILRCSAAAARALEKNLRSTLKDE